MTTVDTSTVSQQLLLAEPMQRTYCNRSQTYSSVSLEKRSMSAYVNNGLKSTIKFRVDLSYCNGNIAVSIFLTSGL